MIFIKSSKGKINFPRSKFHLRGTAGGSNNLSHEYNLASLLVNSSATLAQQFDINFNSSNVLNNTFAVELSEALLAGYSVYLDSGNSASYPGTGLTWYDIVSPYEYKWLFDESGGATTFTDTWNSKVLTVSGSVTSGITGKIGNGITFAGGHLESDITVGSAFTWNCWARRNANASADGFQFVVENRQVGVGGAMLLIDDDSSYRPYVYTEAGNLFANIGTTMALSVWIMLTVTWNGNLLQLYVDGVLQTATLNTTTLNDTAYPIRIGTSTRTAVSTATSSISIDDLRIYPYPLTQAEVTAIHTAAGSGTSLQEFKNNAVIDPDVVFANDEFTVSGLTTFPPFYIEKVPVNDDFTMLVNVEHYQTTEDAFSFVGPPIGGSPSVESFQLAYHYPTQELRVMKSYWSIEVPLKHPLPQNVNTIVGVRRSSNVWTFFVDGKAVGPYTSSSIVFKTTLAFLGLGCNTTWNTGAGIDLLNGKFKKFAFYPFALSSEQVRLASSHFDPSISIDPYYDNVSLLLYFNGTDGMTTFYDSSKTPKTLTTVGNAQIDTSQFKWGGSSLLLDGSGDYLTVPDSNDFNFGSGDFTIETWVRYTSTVGFPTFYSQSDSAGTGNYAVVFGYSSGVGVYFQYTTDGSTIVTSSRPFTPSTAIWYHVAVSRSGNTARIFVDGVQTGADIDMTGVTIFNSTETAKVGNAHTGCGSCSINGHLDGFRITKGVARYTANFTPTEF